MSQGKTGPGRDGRVATLLRTTREARALSQLKLAERTGLARSTVINAEEGKRDATWRRPARSRVRSTCRC